MTKRSKFSISLGIILMMLFMMLPQTFITKAYGDDFEDKEEVVLFEGSAHGSGSWDPWDTLVDIKDMPLSKFQTPFNLEINYQGSSAPYVIFQSWSGGSTWAQATAAYTSKGVAYYTYDSFCDAYGSKDFSTLNNINIRPGGSDVTITSVKLVPQSDEPVSVDYKGPAGKIVKDINAGWNLGGSFEVFGDWISQSTDGAPDKFETAWGNPVTTKQVIDTVKAAGFNAIRIPITWTQHFDSNNNIEKRWMDRIQEVVDYAKADGMYCIINVHHDVDDAGWLWASDNSVNKNKEKFISLWTQIADRFKDYDDNLLFEGFNEILDEKFTWSYPGKEATNAVNILNQMFVDTVRSSGGNNGTRCLVVNSYAASVDGDILDDFVLPQDTVKDSMIVQVHSYTPYSYANVIGEYTQQTAWKEKGGKSMVDGILLNLYHHYTSNNIPVIIGEFAAANKDNTPDRVEYTSYLINNCKKYGIKCFWWDQGGKYEVDSKYGYQTGMGLLNRYSMTWEYPEIVKAMTGIDPTKPVLLGDVNNDGSVDAIDCLLLKRYLVKNKSDDFDERNADINGDGKINLADLIKLKELI